MSGLGSKSLTAVNPLPRLRRRTHPARLLGAIGLLASCAGGTIPSAPPPSTAFQSTFIRRIVPFEVRDGAGVPYAHPFVGGLNVPRPQLVDIDADDDLDLFVQEMSGRVMFFEHEGAGSVLRTRRRGIGSVWLADRLL
jgi:hypothetical protein